MLKGESGLDSQSIDYGSSHLGKGKGYDDNFQLMPGRSLMWELEQRALEQLVGDRLFSSHLDFACGTGRLLAFLSTSTRTRTGLDISPTMASVAREKCPNATIVVDDFRRDQFLFGDDNFDLVTAFRFFANAQSELRAQAMEFLANRLAPNGVMLVNNHRNLDSLAYRVLGRIKSTYRTSGMRFDNMVELARSSGLELVSVLGLGFLPQTERWSPLPWSATAWLERRLASTGMTRHRLAYNVIYTFRKPEVFETSQHN